MELQEVPPPVRVHRSRLAFALAVTLAAVPILVMDNLPATAETDHGPVTAAAPTTEMSIVLLHPSTTTTVASPTTVAPATTAAPTTHAPTTTERAVVQAAEAPTPTTRPRPRPTTTTTAPTPKANGDPSDPATWDKLAGCEAGGNWAMNSGNGYYGGLQFSLATWQNVGGSGRPDQASRTEQIKRGQILQARNGWGAWPTCAHKLGYY